MSKRSSRSVLQVIAAIAFFIILLSVIRYVEKDAEGSSIKTLFDAFWYSIVTLTTVGYGDSYPVTVTGKMISLVLILFSLGVLSYVIGQISSKIQQYMENKKLGQFGTDLSNHVILVGWNDFGKLIADEIHRAGQKLAIITDNKNDVDIIHKLYDENVFVYFGEVTSIEAVEKSNIANSVSLFINLSDDSKALVYLINLRKNFKGVNVVAYLSNTELKDTFYSAGATYVIPEKDISSKLIASFVFEPDVAKYTEDLLTTSDSSDGFDMFEFKMVDGNPFLGNNCMEVFIKLKKDHNAVLLGISKKKGSTYQLIKNPGENDKIEFGDYLIIVADGNTKKDIEQLFSVHEGRMLRVES
jgi:voltage-gated potassium channel